HCFVFFDQRPLEPARFVLERAQQCPALGTLLDVRGEFESARALELSLEIQQAGHLISVRHRTPREPGSIAWPSHAWVPAASPAEPRWPSALRNWWRARSRMTPTNVRRTPSVSAISS